jgi:hypothetical protein
MTTDLETMIATFDADISRFERKMDAMGVSFDRQIAKVAQRQGKMIHDMNSGWNAISFGGIESAWKKVEGIFLAGGLTLGMADVVKSSLEVTASISKIAQQAGVSTSKLQEMRFAVSQTGGTAADADAALITFNKNFGMFLDSGSGRAAQSFKSLGIDKMIDSGQVRTTQDALDAVINKIEGYSSAAERAGFAARLFGQDAGPKLAGLLEQGAAGIAALEARAHALGLVMNDETISAAREAEEKLSALFDVIKTEGIAAIANLAPEIADIGNQLVNALPSVIAWSEHWADFFGLIKQSPLSKFQYEFDQAQSSLNDLVQQKASQSIHMPGWDAQFDAEIADAKDRLAKARAALTDAELAPIIPTRERTEADIPAYVAAHPPAVHVNDIAAQQKAAEAAKQAAELNQRRVEALAGFGADTATANAVQLLKGTTGYYEAVRNEIDDDLAAKLNAIDAEEQKKLASLAKLKLADDTYYRNQIEAEANAKRSTAVIESAGKVDSTGMGSVTGDALSSGDAQIRQYEAQTAALGQLVGEAARYAFYKGVINAAAEKGIALSMKDVELIPGIKEKGEAIAAAATSAQSANEKYQQSVQVTDSLRQGLDSIGTAGLKGFSSMRDAATQFLNQLSELIVKLYIIQPLINELLGPQGTAGSGLAGGGVSAASSWLSGLTSRAPTTFSPLFGASINAGDGITGVNVTPNIFGNYLGGSSGVGASGGLVGDAFSWIGSLFDTGGYTGSGPRDKAAGVVHAGEYVFDQDSVRKIGLGNLMMLHAGYADGGLAGYMPGTPSLRVTQGGSASYRGGDIHIHGNTDDDTLGKIQSAMKDQDRRMLRMMEEHTPRIVTNMAVRNVGPWN